MKSAFLLLSLSLQLGAATYYVDSLAGNDSAAGTSTATAWKSIARVNTATLRAGDQVLFHRGQTWREQLNLAANGAPGSPVTLDAYDLGSTPTIAGSDVLSGWTLNSSGVYAASSPVQPANVYVDNGDPLVRASSLVAAMNTPGSWYREPKFSAIYVHLADSGNPSTHLVEAAVRPFGIYSAGSNYISINNLAIKQVAETGIYATTANEYWSISNCQIRNTTEAGIYVLPGFTGLPMLKGWVIQNNTIGRIDVPPSTDYDRAGILVRGTTGTIIKGNAVATFNKFGIRVADYFGMTLSSSPTVEANVLGMNQGNISIAYTPNAVVNNNIIRNSKGYGIGIGGASSSNAIITNNVISNLAISDDMALYNGLDCNVGATNGLFSHNTVVGVTNYSLTLESNDNLPCTNWTVTNNILDARTNIPHPANGGITGVLFSTVGANLTTFSNNDYMAAPAASQNAAIRYMNWDYSIAGWLQLAQQLNPLATDPMFMNVAAGDFNLQPSSPCRMTNGTGGCGRFTN